MVGKISDLKTEILCSDKVHRNSWFHTKVDLGQKENL